MEVVGAALKRPNATLVASLSNRDGYRACQILLVVALSGEERTPCGFP